MTALYFMRLIGLCVFIFGISLYSKADADFKSPPLLPDAEKSQFQQWLKMAGAKNDDRVFSNAKGAYLNALVNSASPYLRQHAKNPVNWKPWRNEFLEKAQSENKLIFLSIGYSTCHWCHVMAKESFADVEVAEAVNESYIAIKVDREELPQIDRYFASLLEAVKGSAGWPITAIINSDGLPIYIDSYLPKENLLTLLRRVSATWEANPEFLLTTAKTIAGLIAEAESQEDNPLAIEAAELLQRSRQKIMDALDSEFGGLEGEVKFPHEALLLYQLDELRRAVNPDLEKLVSLQLDSMMTGGIRDAVDGGFHRYSTDGQWRIPHYEKMLYNQALMAQVYLEAWQVFYDDSYRFIAKETLDFAIKYLYREGKGFYSALDADFKGEEGGFYLWSKADIEAAERVAGVSVYQFQPAGELSEANGLLKNVGEAADARQNQAKERSLSVINEHFEPDFNAAAATQVVFQQPVKFGVLADPQLRGPEMSVVLDKLSQQRHRRGELHRDDKVITSWNGLMIASLALASMAFDSQQYLRIAENLGDFFWDSRFDRPTGRLYRTTDQSQEIFSLEDYAYLARGYVELYDATRDPKWLNRAIAIYHSAKADPALFQSAGSLMATVKASFDLIDGELISPQVAFLEVELALKNRASDPKLFKVDPSDLNNVKNRVFESAINRFASLRYLNNHLNGSSDNKRFFAHGHGQLTVVCTDVSVGVCQSIELQFHLQNNWHINSNRPLQDYLEPTKIESRANLAVEYPEDKVVKLGFQDEPLSLYEGEFTISVTKKTDEAAGKVMVNLPLQACNDELCLLPEVHSFVF